MSTINASGKVVGVTEADNGGVSVTIISSRVLDSGAPSFKLTYDFPAGSAAATAYPLDTLVSFNITTTPPVTAAPAVPAADQFTTTESLSSSSGPEPEVTPEPTETPVEAPVADPAAPVEETPAETPVDPAPVAEPVVDPAPVEPAPVEADAVPLAEEPPAV